MDKLSTNPRTVLGYRLKLTDLKGNNHEIDISKDNAEKLVRDLFKILYSPRNIMLN